MFLEPNIKGDRHGWIEVICGSMFSGKTEELIRRLKRVKIANLSWILFKPEIDKRYHDQDVVSHDANSLKAIPVSNSSDILKNANGLDVIAIDEAQFLDDTLVEVCEKLVNEGKRVIVAGLDMDFKGMPFGPVPQLLSIADYITKLHAICVKCGNMASRSYRKTTEKGQLLVGKNEIYEPRCRSCSQLPK